MHFFHCMQPFLLFNVGNSPKRSSITHSLMVKIDGIIEACQHSDLIGYYLGCLSFVCHEVNSHCWAFTPLTCVSDLAATLPIDHSISAEFLSALQMGKRFNSPPRLQEACHTHRCSHLQTITHTRLSDTGSHQWWVFWLNMDTTSTCWDSHTLTYMWQAHTTNICFKVPTRGSMTRNVLMLSSLR